MMDANRSIARRIQTYLDQVSAALRDEQLGSEDIETICDGLNEQILDMASQSGPVSESSVARAIASMEEPGRFAESVRTAAHERPYPPDIPKRNEVMHLLATLGFYLAIAGPALALVLGIIVDAIAGGGMEFGSFILFSAAIVALIFGGIARREARGRAAILVSMGTVAGYFLMVLIAFLLG